MSATRLFPPFCPPGCRRFSRPAPKCPDECCRRCEVKRGGQVTDRERTHGQQVAGDCQSHVIAHGLEGRLLFCQCAAQGSRPNAETTGDIRHGQAAVQDQGTDGMAGTVGPYRRDDGWRRVKFLKCQVMEVPVRSLQLKGHIPMRQEQTRLFLPEPNGRVQGGPPPWIARNRSHGMVLLRLNGTLSKFGDDAVANRKDDIVQYGSHRSLWRMNPISQEDVVLVSSQVCRRS